MKQFYREHVEMTEEASAQDMVKLPLAYRKFLHSRPVTIAGAKLLLNDAVRSCIGAKPCSYRSFNHLRKIEPRVGTRYWGDPRKKVA